MDQFWDPAALRQRAAPAFPSQTQRPAYSILFGYPWPERTNLGSSEIVVTVDDDGSPWILAWMDDAEPNEEDVVDDSLRPFLVEDAQVAADDSEVRASADIDAETASDEPDLDAQPLTTEEAPASVDVDQEQVEADADDQVAQVTVDAEASAMPIDEQAEEPDPGEEAPVALTEDAVVVTFDAGLELTEGSDDEPEFGDDAFIVVVLGDETTLVLTEQDDEPELDTVTLEATMQLDEPATPDNIEPALLAWVDLDEFHPDLEFGLEIFTTPPDNPPAQTNYVWIHRARRRGIR